MTTHKWASPDRVPSETKDDLLAPPLDATSTTNADIASGDDAFLTALRDGTIPAFDDEASLPTEPGQPLDPAAEHAAYLSLVDMINRHKDAGTTVTILDPAAFLEGLD